MSLRTRTSPLPHDCALRAARLPTSALVVAAVVVWFRHTAKKLWEDDLAYTERRYALRQRGQFSG